MKDSLRPSPLPFSSTSPALDTPQMLTWDRLPTPIHFEVSSPGSLISPPLSRAPSPDALRKKTSAFFSNPFSSAAAPDPPPPHSRTSAFFFSNGTSTPTPPPSVHSDASPPKMPPLSRFFPSRRVSPERDDADIASSTSSNSSPRRTFVTVPDVAVSLPDAIPSSVDSNSSNLALRSRRTSETPKPPPLRRDTVPAAPPAELHADVEITSDEATLVLLRELGRGAFSSVWLARDKQQKLLLKRESSFKRPPRSECVVRRGRDRKLDGLRPRAVSSNQGVSRNGSVYLRERDGEGASAPGEKLSQDDEDGNYDLVAVKMVDREMCSTDDRTRISFVREVEVLRHISHPSIVSYLHSFTTLTHHCLVLEALTGGELFSLIASDTAYSALSEPFRRRMFGEICLAVGWMHGVGLVHRDIKLENILLTCSTLPSLDFPGPLVKLADFGLSRFIDPESPLLTTRCGSESYAAPELVTGIPYDGRSTDAWACGLVLFALETRVLPFDMNACGRRAFLLSIAKGEYKWPDGCVASEGARKVVGALLVRDPKRRARVVDLWDEEWMRGEGAPRPPLAKVRDEHPAEFIASDGELIGKLEEIPSVVREEIYQ